MNIIPKIQRNFSFAALLIAGCSGLSLWGGETTVLSDQFSNASIEEETASIRSETSWFGFTKGGGRLPSIQDIDIDGDTVSVLDFSAQSQMTLIAAAFPLVELKRPGDYIQLTVEYRYRYPLKGVVPAFVIGLYDSAGAPPAAGDLRRDLNAKGAVGSNHMGVRLAKLPAQSKDDLQLDQTIGLGALFPQTKVDTTNSGLTLAYRDVHEMTLRVTLAEGGNLVFSYGVGGVIKKYSTVTAQEVPITRFNEVSICPIGRGFETAGNYYVQLLNVKVTTGGL